MEAKNPKKWQEYKKEWRKINVLNIIRNIIRNISWQIIIINVWWIYIKGKGWYKPMNILSRAIVSNSEMTKNYKSCREKAEEFGKIFILKNNQPDAVLFSIDEYKRLSVLIEYMESLNEEEIAEVAMSLPHEGLRRTYTMDQLNDGMCEKTVEIDMTV